MPQSSIPNHLFQNRYWSSMLHLFINHPKLNQVFTTNYFDLYEEIVKVQSLKRKAAVWSNSERIMVNLALHLFNERNKIILSDLDYLDETNKELVMEAVKIRFY